MKVNTIVLSAMAMVAATGAVKAETYDLTMGSSHPQVFPWVGALSSVIVEQSNARLEAMGSEDRIEWTENYGGALFGFQDTLEGIGDGLADAGWVGTLWEESKMPLQNITYYTPFVVDDVVVLAEVMDQLHLEVPALSEAWEEQNLVYLGGSTADTYQMFTKFPFDELSDLEGTRILAPGPAGAWFPTVGATPIDGGLPSYYNQLATGVADGALTIVTGYFPNRLYEVAPYVTIVNMGAAYTGGFAVNLDVWDGLSDDVQLVLTELGAEYAAANAEQVAANYERFMGLLEEDPDVTVSTLPDAERQAWIDALPDLSDEWQSSDAAAEEVLAAYMQAIRNAGVTPSRNWDN